MTRLPPALLRVGALLAAFVAIAPTHASAQLTATYQPFGARTGTISFMTQPLGLAECSTAIPIRFTNLTSSPTARYLDMWSAATATAMCESGMTRSSATSLSCTSVPLTGNTFQNAILLSLSVTGTQLFGATACTGVTTTRSFYVFDTVSSPDASTTFTAAQFTTLTFSIDSQAPSPPVLGAGPAGDTSVTVTWTNPSDIGTQGGVMVYFDPAGCSGTPSDTGGVDAGASSGALVAGGVPPASLLVFEQRSQSITSAAVPAATLGWSAASYGQRGAFAVSVLDNAFNPSRLSNVVCAEHVSVTGFWNRYCTEHGLTVAECSARYRGCSVALPSRRPDLVMIAALTLLLGAVLVRRRVR